MIAHLIEQIQKKQAPIVVGLDPMWEFVPEPIRQAALEAHGESLEAAGAALWEYNRGLIDALWELAPAVKPQIAMYEQFGLPGLEAYVKTIAYAREKGMVIIGDIKRGDIGSTSAAYAKGHLGRVRIGRSLYRPFPADFVTLNPYMGDDAIRPFLEECQAEDKGVFILCKTSNPSSGDFQDQLVEGQPLYDRVADKIRAWGEECMDGEYSNVGAVVGATYPQMAEELRRRMPRTYILVPGYGAQGASGKDLRAFFNSDGLGAIVNSSRGIIAAYQQKAYAGMDYQEAARAAFLAMREDINSHIRA